MDDEHGAGPGAVTVAKGDPVQPGTTAADQNALRRAFMALGQLQRSALELAHSGGMTVPAIATALGEEPAAVRQALRQALLQLAKAQ